MPDPDYQEITVLIPAYSIEDLPTDLNESAAASLLNAFAVAWHPHLLSRSGSLPGYQQAESSDLPTSRQIVLLPECSEEWLGHDWREHFQDNQSLILSDCSSRSDWLSAIREQLGLAEDLSSAFLDPFFALGTCHLQVSLLSRRMHYFVDPDSYVMESEAMAAANAAVAGDMDKMNDHLRRCFECLQECREQFQPTDCYLIDVCLPSEQNTSAELTELVSSSPNLTLICSGQELQAHCESSEEFRAALEKALEENRLALMAGQYHELRTSLSSLSTLYGDIRRTRRWLLTLGGAEHMHWARRRFGMTSAVPAVLLLFDVKSALHVALDDGIYPDREHGQMQWQAPDGSCVNAVSRIPMAIDGATSFQRFADRFTESMQEDNTAVMLLARLPEVQSPWLQDLRIAETYAPALGRFVTMTEFIDYTSDHATPTQYDDGEYLSPYLIQSSVLKTEAPISSPAALHRLRGELESIAGVAAMSWILRPAEAGGISCEQLESSVNNEEFERLALDGTADLDAQSARLNQIAKEMTDACKNAADSFIATVSREAQGTRGVCLINSLPWQRRELVRWPADMVQPAQSPAVEEARRQGDQLYLLADVPAGGFVWLSESSSAAPAVSLTVKDGKPLAEDLLLRNNFFEVQLSETTGGISSVTFYNQRANRVSQQVAFHYENNQTYSVDGEDVTTSYATPRLVSSQVRATGPVTGSVETTCEIADVVTGDVMARFRQTVSVERHSCRLHLSIVFDELTRLPSGNPWMTYFASRFAWENEGASIVRSMLGQARGFRMERFEAPDYIEVADSDTRLAILPHGRPYHRRSGHRMLDSLLIVEGETERSFDFTVDFDQAWPMRVATELQRPILQQQVQDREPSGAAAAWIFGLSSKNVLAARVRMEQGTENSPDALVLLLQETEGRPTKCTVRTARTPRKAQLRTADGTVLTNLDLSAGGVEVEMGRFQIREVALTF